MLEYTLTAIPAAMPFCIDNFPLFTQSSTIVFSVIIYAIPAAVPPDPVPVTLALFVQPINLQLSAKQTIADKQSLRLLRFLLPLTLQFLKTEFFAPIAMSAAIPLVKFSFTYLILMFFISLE